jgi:hypothetical protein
MYMWLRMESGEMGEGGEESREVVGRCTESPTTNMRGSRFFLGCLIPCSNDDLSFLQDRLGSETVRYVEIGMSREGKNSRLTELKTQLF